MGLRRKPLDPLDPISAGNAASSPASDITVASLKTNEQLGPEKLPGSFKVTKISTIKKC